MKAFRTALFWLHLAAGVAAGLVILVMSVTGALLALKPQIVNRIESRRPFRRFHGIFARQRVADPRGRSREPPRWRRMHQIGQLRYERYLGQQLDGGENK
jgi:hypothetical protein